MACQAPKSFSTRIYQRLVLQVHTQKKKTRRKHRFHWYCACTQAGEAAQPYAEGGALFALGLIHANTGGSDSETVAYLEEQLRNNASHVVKHGACLGLGFTAMAAGTESLYDVIKETLDGSDKAVAGEVRSLVTRDLVTPKWFARLGFTLYRSAM